MISKENLPDELEAVLNSPEFDDEAGILIETVSFKDEDLYLALSIRFDSYVPIPSQLWEVVVQGIKEEKISNAWTKDIAIYNEHVLLLEFKSPYTELYLKGTSENAQVMFIEIFDSLLSLSEDIDDISRYVLTPQRIEKLSQQGHGLFARGPKVILNIYAQCMQKNGIKPIFIGDWEQSEANKSLKLLKFGDSYCIGHTITFHRKS